MKFWFMRLVDRYAGAFLLRMLSLLKIIGFPFKKKVRLAEGEHPRWILIQKFLGVGSIVNAIPLIQLLRAEYPDVKIVFLTFKPNSRFLELTRLADKTVLIDDSNFLRFTLTTLTALYELNRTGVDVCCDLEFFTNYSMVTSFLSRAPIRIGYFSYGHSRSNLLTLPASFNHYQHISRIYLSIAESLGIKIPKNGYCISLPRSEYQQQRDVLIKLGVPEKGEMLVVNPNASPLCELRKWPPEKYATLIDKITSTYPDKFIIVIGSPSEKTYVDSVVERCRASGKLINAAGKTTLEELMVLLEICEALVSNDSGPVHLAAGYATPTVAIYGPETPVLYGPCNENAVSLYTGVYCSPCINVLDNKSFTDCTTVKCMNSISPEEVFETLELLLKGELTPPADDAVRQLLDNNGDKFRKGKNSHIPRYRHTLR